MTRRRQFLAMLAALLPFGLLGRPKRARAVPVAESPAEPEDDARVSPSDLRYSVEVAADGLVNLYLTNNPAGVPIPNARCVVMTITDTWQGEFPVA